MPDILQGGFPEVMPDRDTDFAECEFPMPTAKTGVGQDGPVPPEFQGKSTIVASTPQAHRTMADTAASGQSGGVSGSAHHPVIALEEVLSKSHSSYGSVESALKVGAELQLQGKLESDSVLSLLGERVEVDDRGNFSVRLKLDSGPALWALLFGQRKRPEDPH